MKDRKSKIVNFIFTGIFAVSMSILSVQLIVSKYYSNKNIVITALISFVVAIYFYRKTYKEIWSLIRSNVGFAVLIALLTLIVLYRLHIDKIFLVTKNIPLRLRFFAISSISAIYLAIYIGNKIKDWIETFYNSLDKWEKKAYVIASVVSILAIVVAYSTNNDWYLVYDKVYSIDSGYIFKSFILDEGLYYSIRHPLYSVFIFPFSTILNAGINFILQGKEISIIVKAIIAQIINSQLLILTGLMLKKITKNKVIFIAYMISYPTIMYSLFFEKYQICVFLLVLYIYTICTDKEKSIPSLVLAAGIMPTSSVVGIAELLTKDKLKEKVKKILKILIVAILTFICLGRAITFRTGLGDVKKLQKGFSNVEFSAMEEINVTNKLIQGTFFGLSSELTNSSKPEFAYLEMKGENIIYWWSGLQSQIAPMAYIIIVFIIIGAIKNRKELFVKISIIWIAFMFALFLGANWAIQEAPLFSIYFSWAIIPLTIMGIDYVIEKLKFSKKIVYALLISCMIIINTWQLVQLSNALTQITSEIQEKY